MTDILKISELPLAETITGTELVPVVQAGVTRRTTAANVNRGLPSPAGQPANLALLTDGAGGFSLDAIDSTDDRLPSPVGQVADLSVMTDGADGFKLAAGGAGGGGSTAGYLPGDVVFSFENDPAARSLLVPGLIYQESAYPLTVAALEGVLAPLPGLSVDLAQSTIPDARAGARFTRISANGQTLVAARYVNSSWLLSVYSIGPLGVTHLGDFDPPSAAQIYCIDLTADGNFLAVGYSSAPGLEIYSVSSVAPFFTLVTSDATLAAVNAAAWSPDGTMLGVLRDTSTSSVPSHRVWGFNGTALSAIAGAPELNGLGPHNLSFSPDGQWMLVSYASYTRIFDVTGVPSGTAWTQMTSTNAVTSSSPLNSHHAWLPDSSGFFAVSGQRFFTVSSIGEIEGSQTDSFAAKPRVDNPDLSTGAYYPLITPDGNFLICTAGSIGQVLIYERTAVPGASESVWQFRQEINPGAGSVYLSGTSPCSTMFLSGGGSVLAVPFDAADPGMVVYGADGSGPGEFRVPMIPNQGPVPAFLQGDAGGDTGGDTDGDTGGDTDGDTDGSGQPVAGSDTVVGLFTWDTGSGYDSMRIGEDMAALNPDLGTGTLTDWFDQHPIYSQIQDVAMDGQAMVRIPAFYFKAGWADAQTSPTGIAGYYWLLSSTPRTGYELHPAFVTGADTTQDHVDVGKYQAGLDVEDKLTSEAGVLPTFVTGAENGTLVGYATNRNVGGQVGWRVISGADLAAIQMLLTTEISSLDTQGTIALGYIDGAELLQVDAAAVAAASWRGLVGLWGNVRQFVDGIRPLNDSSAWEFGIRNGSSSRETLAGSTARVTDAALPATMFDEIDLASLGAGYLVQGSGNPGTRIAPDVLRWPALTSPPQLAFGSGFDATTQINADGGSLGLFSLTHVSSTYGNTGTRLAKNQ